MSVAVVVLTEQEAGPLLHWTARFARARGCDVLVLRPVGRRLGEASRDAPLDAGAHDDPVTRAVCGAVAELRGSGAEGGPEYGLRELGGSDLAGAVVAAVEVAGAGLLVLGRHGRLSGARAEDALARRLFRIAPCDTLLLRPGDGGWETCRRILVPTAGGPHASVALALAADVAHSEDSQVDALFVEPRVGADAEQVGHKILARLIARGAAEHADRVRPRVLVADDVRSGITNATETASADGYDLLLIGATHQGFVRRMLFGTVPEHLLSGPAAIAVAVVRRATPLTTRLLRTVGRLLGGVVPQLERDDRIALVEHVQSSSQWDFDFIALVCLSTLIASFGLLQSSAAVVIGAMLLAPLMSPLVGTGLALVQGNAALLRSSVRSVLFGFLIAFGIAALAGLLVPGRVATTEMLSRGSPNVLDLWVAFISGVAAAYATARPNLSAALPGVAIAAALVPPIATSGIALAIGRPLLSAGAALLFFTNIVAIVLGAAASLFAVGLRGGHAHSRDRPWVRNAFGTLVVLVTVLAIPLSWVLYARLPGRAVADELVSSLRSRVEQQDGRHLASVRHLRSDDAVELEVVIAAPTAQPATLARDLADVARAHTRRSTRVRLVTRLESRGDSEPAPP